MVVWDDKKRFVISNFKFQISNFCMFKSIGPIELGVVALVVLILFGGSKIPELGKNIGEAIHEIKKAIKGEGK
jgi:sec-independent protein translocase protein TatA